MPSPAVGLLFAHGMGTSGAGYADALISNTLATLDSLEFPRSQVVIQQALWATALRKSEDDLWDRMDTPGNLGFRDLRRFVVSTLGDPIAYRSIPTNTPTMTTYYGIHQRIFQSLQALAAALPDPTCPLILVGHSLGSVILSDHIWDEQQGQGFGRDSFTRGETLAGFVTFGSTIPLFTLDLETIAAISFPGRALTPAQHAAAQWLNFFDRNDVLGYPLRPTSPDYTARVTADIEVAVGGLLKSWNPLCHTEYWGSNDIAKYLARLIFDVGTA